LGGKIGGNTGEDQTPYEKRHFQRYSDGSERGSSINRRRRGRRRYGRSHKRKKVDRSRHFIVKKKKLKVEKKKKDRGKL